MRLEHHLVGGYVRCISPHIITYYYYYNKQNNSNTNMIANSPKYSAPNRASIVILCNMVFLEAFGIHKMMMAYKCYFHIHINEAYNGFCVQ